MKVYPIIISIALGGCVTVPEGIAGPTSVRAQPPADGSTVQVVGRLQVGFEQRFLLDRADRNSCLTVALDEFSLEQAEQLNGQIVVVEGRYRTDLARGNVMLGMCSLDGLEVLSVRRPDKLG